MDVVPALGEYVVSVLEDFGLGRLAEQAADSPELTYE